MRRSLAILDSRPNPATSRVLCVRLAPAEAAAASVGPLEAADAFLRYSPRLAARTDRSGDGAFWLFVDVASTAHLFGGEEALLADAFALARRLGLAVRAAAIADTPSGAQALAASKQNPVSAFGSSASATSCPASPVTCPRGREREALEPLSLPLLFQLEGLEPWPKESAIEALTTFFAEVGFRSLGELARFEAQSMRERWGETGELVWARLRALDRPPISPFAPSEPLRATGHFDFPIALVSLLMHALRPSLEALFERLQGRGLHAEAIALDLRGEYSEKTRRVRLEPCSPSRKLDLFLTLLERKLEEAGYFEDPIRSFEIAIETRPERERQLDFFEPRETDADRLESLISLLKQSEADAGFLRPRPSLLPERAWTREDGGEAVRREIERETRVASVSALGRSYALKPLSREELAAAAVAGASDVRPVEHRPSLSGDPAWGRGDEDEYEDPARSVRATPEYGTDVLEAPRPTRLLRRPKPLDDSELRAMKLLSANPIERLEAAWWAEDDRRDYYYAVSRQGQCLWLYRDAKSEGWFLHGYFD